MSQHWVWTSALFQYDRASLRSIAQRYPASVPVSERQPILRYNLWPMAAIRLNGLTGSGQLVVITWGLVAVCLAVIGLLVFTAIVHRRERARWHEKDRISSEAINNYEQFVTVLAGASKQLEKTSQAILKLLPHWVLMGQIRMSTDELDALIQTLIQIALTNLIGLYDITKVFRSSVLIPNDNNGDLLACYTSIGLPAPESVFMYYIGHDTVRRAAESGMAGTVYLSDVPRLCHMDSKTLKHECPEYRYPNDLLEWPDDIPINYKAFVTIPLSSKYLGIRLPRDEEKKLGVVCLDSNDRDTFDKDPLRDPHLKQGWVALPLLRVIFYLLLWRDEVMSNNQP